MLFSSKAKQRYGRTSGDICATLEGKCRNGVSTTLFVLSYCSLCHLHIESHDQAAMGELCAALQRCASASSSEEQSADMAALFVDTAAVIEALVRAAPAAAIARLRGEGIVGADGSVAHGVFSGGVVTPLLAAMQSGALAGDAGVQVAGLRVLSQLAHSSGAATADVGGGGGGDGGGSDAAGPRTVSEKNGDYFQTSCIVILQKLIKNCGSKFQRLVHCVFEHCETSVPQRLFFHAHHSLLSAHYTALLPPPLRALLRRILRGGRRRFVSAQDVARYSARTRCAGKPHVWVHRCSESWLQNRFQLP